MPSCWEISGNDLDPRCFTVCYLLTVWGPASGPNLLLWTASSKGTHMAHLAYWNSQSLCSLQPDCSKGRLLTNSSILQPSQPPVHVQPQSVCELNSEMDWLLNPLISVIREWFSIVGPSGALGCGSHTVMWLWFFLGVRSQPRPCWTSNCHWPAGQWWRPPVFLQDRLHLTAQEGDVRTYMMLFGKWRRRGQIQGRVWKLLNEGEARLGHSFKEEGHICKMSKSRHRFVVV